MNAKQPDLLLRETSEGDVVAALSLLREALGEEEHRIRLEGSLAMTKGDYVTARVVIEFAERLLAFTNKVESLGSEWQSLEDLRDKASPEVQQIVSKRFFGRKPKGEVTPQSAFERPILEVLVEMGGRGKAKAVIDRVGERMTKILKPKDFEYHQGSDRQIRWRNSAMWARNIMANNDGRMKKDSTYGYWEISSKGRAWLRPAGSPKATPSPGCTMVKNLGHKAKVAEVAEVAIEGTCKGVGDASNRNAEGRDCSRRTEWRGYDLPRVRPPRGVATPDGFDASRWTEKEGKGSPKYCVRDAYNVNQVRFKGINHTSMRSLCVAGMALAAKGQGDFDPTALHSFVIHGDDTFIVW